MEPLREIKASYCFQDKTGTVPCACPRCRPEQPKREELCQHVYESDCHGIEMIKSPIGKEWAIGGTNVKEQFLFDPWCGKRIKPVEKSLAEKFAEHWNITPCSFGGNNYSEQCRTICFEKIAIAHFSNKESKR